MKVSHIPELLRVAYAANVPVLLQGRHGIGKSMIFDEAARQMSIGVRVLDLSLMDPVDLLGLPQIIDGHVVYVAPALLPRDGRGLLLLEELNRAPALTRAPALELLTRRRLNDYCLPAGWLPCASINPAADGYAVDDLDPALRSRFMVLTVEPDHRQWCRWARSHDIHPVIVRYVEAAPDIFTAPHVNPRALEYASRFLSAFDVSTGLSGARLELVKEALSGLLGEVVATAIVRSIGEPPQVFHSEDVLGRYPRLRSAVRRSVHEGRLDLVRSILQQLQDVLGDQRAWQAVQQVPSRSDNLTRFLADIPPDMRLTFESWMKERGYIGSNSS